MVTINCAECGTEKISRYKTTKFCGDNCRRKYNGKHRGHEQTCKQCGQLFNKYKTQDYCSVECFSNSKNKQQKINTFDKVCSICHKVFSTTKNNKKYCSDDCSYQNVKNKAIMTAKKKRELDVVYYQKRCKECGKHFTSTRNKATFCSNECSCRFENRRKETTRRSRIVKNGKVNWDISIERLIKRDGLKCYLCEEDVIIKVDSNHDYYPSIEHVVPVSKGGTHTWDNVRLAHRKCNYIKSDELI